MTTRCLLACVLLSATLTASFDAAQDAPSASRGKQSRPEFEVASVRSSSDQPNQVNVGLRITGTQVRVSYLSLKDYIAMAYHLRPNQIVAPDWTAQQRYDIVATIPAGVSMTQVPEMLQSLLADRFRLMIHRESKEFPVYALTVGKNGPKISPLPPAADTDPDKPPAVNVAASGSGNGVAVDLGGGSSFSLGNNKLEARRMTMAQFADVLTRFVDRPVIDMTQLTGQFNLTLDIAPEDYTAILVRSAINQGVSLPAQALRVLDTASGNPIGAPLQQLGFALDARRAPLDVIVVDSSLKTPTEN
jgi:uncharacterized protein (TIGR03435 family)